MESIDSSPNGLKATTRFAARKEDSPGGSECGEDISISSSTGKSTTRSPPYHSPKLKNSGIKYRSNNKKALKNFGSVKSFRRRANTRLIQSSAVVKFNDDVSASQSGALVGSSASSPHYLMATSSSQGKKMCSHLSPRYSESSFHGNDENGSSVSQSMSGSPKPLRTLSRDSSFKGLRFLVKKASFKPRKTGLKCSVPSKDISIDRATYSSTIKDSKFPEPVEIHRGGAESNKLSAMRVCRYHHCSLHGHHHGDHDHVPQPKRSLFRRKWSMKRQRSMRPKTESWHGSRQGHDKKKELQNIRIMTSVESSNLESNSNVMAFSRVGNKNISSYEEIHIEPESKLVGDGYDSIRESGLFELAFGESTYPDRSYQESVDILRKYSYEEQDFGQASFGLNDHCLNCSCPCHKKAYLMSIHRSAGAETSQSESNLSGTENVNKDEIPKNVLGPTSSFSGPDKEVSYPIDDSPTLSCANGGFNEDDSVTPVTTEVTENNSASYSSSDSRMSSHINSDEDGDAKTESKLNDDSKVGEALGESVAISSIHSGVKLQFSKRSHISMWNLIHQHMSTNMAVEPAEKSFEVAGESSADDANTTVAKEISTSDTVLSDSRVEVENNQSENHDIEVRKLFAIKLVREAIEKILLPEVQDQASDDQSTISQSTPRAEIVEKNQSQGFKQDDNGDTDANIGKDYAMSNPTEESHTTDDTSLPEIKKTEKKAASESEKKAPKHWSYLKKWFLLQKFIKALETVRKFNPRKPHFLPLNSDPEAEKVNLRPQTVDERKNAEEWMLDYALRQAVGQLAPTQKKKVSLLIKAFETVVPPQEENHFRSPRLGNNVSGTNAIADKASKFASKHPGSENIEQSLKPQISTVEDDEKSSAIENDPCPVLHSDAVNPENSAIGTKQEALPKSKGLQETVLSDYIQEKVNESGESSIQLDRNTHIKMWHMVYQHVISDIAEKVGSRLLDGSEYHDGSAEKSPAANNSNFAHDFPKLSDESSNLRSSFTQSDILKLIKDAVDGILLRDVQDDSSDTQSGTSESITDLDISERNIGEIGGLNVSNEGEKTEPQSQANRKFELSKSKNWSKVKKLVLLKRSIRALEKARKLKTQTCDLLPRTPDPEPEKIELRTQVMDEKNKAEQWMLDYAVRCIVTKLTPARKERVSMLVEAFEAVVPFPET